MDIKKSAIILNGFIHDFAAGIWLASIVAIAVLHDAHLRNPEVIAVLNELERLFFWGSVGAMVIIIATGAGRTFTYVENWYGPDAERVRRKMLIIKHIVLFGCFAAGYFFVYGKVFH
jgi:uncharacterized membrane protein